MFYQKMLTQKQQLEQQIQAITSQLESLPAGHLTISCNDTRYKWYQTKDHQKSYIPKDKQALAEQLAVKKYLVYQLQELLCEKKAIDLYLKQHDTGPYKSEELLTTPSGYQKLLAPLFQPSSQKLLDWINAPYPHNEAHPENLIHQTASGKMVRSKSEAIIDLILSQNQIPFRYEAALPLGSKTFYPDFTILHPKTYHIYYWEHFGLMDDPDYRQTAIFKLQFYISHGIIPSIQLITTYETKLQPLCTLTVEKIVSEYFL